MSKDFDWNHGENSDDIIFPTTSGVAVYINKNDDVVIRQQAGFQDDDDAVIIVPKLHLKALIIALKEAAQ